MLIGSPPALRVWAQEFKRNPSERRRIREIARRVAAGLRKMREREKGLFARMGVGE